MRSSTIRWMPLAALPLLACVGACSPSAETPAGAQTADSARGGGSTSGVDAANTSDSGGSGDASAATTPTVLTTSPATDATGVPRNSSISATFSEAMNPGSLAGATFTLTQGTTTVPIEGTLTYGNGAMVFWPSAHLVANSPFVATITIAAKSAAGRPLADAHVWTFATGDSLAATLPVNLGTAGNFAILAKSAVSTVPTAAVTGDVGVSPAAATYITGFALTLDATNIFSTATQVVGKVYAADYAQPTPANLTTAIGDMELAFTAAGARAPDVTELGAGNIGGKTIAAGVYKWGTGLLIPTDVTLSGSATDVWIFQIAQDLTVSSGAKVLLAGGALAKNIFWSVAGQVDMGTTSHLEGAVLSQTAITLHTGASVNGRLLAQTAANIDGSTIVAVAPGQ